MNEYRSVLERAGSNFAPLDLELERVLRGRDRKRRNQRIAAGVVGIAVFVAAVGLVTTFGSSDRAQPGASGGAGTVPTETGPTETGPTETGPTETGPTETGPTETGPTETGPTETGPPSAPAYRAPDVVEQEMCTDGARVRLEVTNIGGVTGLFSSIVVRFELHGSPVGHEWRILLERFSGMDPPIVLMRGTRVASDNGDLVVQRSRFRNGMLRVRFRASALDRQTGQVCTVSATAARRE